MSRVDGHIEGAGGQKDNVSLTLIKDCMPKGLRKVKLPPSSFEEMSEHKTAETLIYRTDP